MLVCISCGIDFFVLFWVHCAILHWCQLPLTWTAWEYHPIINIKNYFKQSYTDHKICITKYCNLNTKLKNSLDFCSAPCSWTSICFSSLWPFYLHLSFLNNFVSLIMFVFKLSRDGLKSRSRTCKTASDNWDYWVTRLWSAHCCFGHHEACHTYCMFLMTPSDHK